MEIRELPLAGVHAGMVLAGDVFDAAGEMLLPAGTMLTAPMLASLSRHGIATLAVRDPAAARVERLFRRLDPHHADAWAAQQLKQYVTAWRRGGGA